MRKQFATLACISIVALAGSGALPARGQPSSSPASTDSVALTSEFQQLLERYIGLEPAPRSGTRDAFREWRTAILPDLDQLLVDFSALSQRSGNAPDVLLVQALVHARRAGVYLDQRRELDAEYNALLAESSDEAIRSERPDLIANRAMYSDLVAKEYERIEDSLGAALERADQLRDERQMSLVQGVILAQSAIVRDRAVDAAQSADQPVVWDVSTIRQLLDDSERLLQEYMATTDRSNGLEWVRGYFYLGVVQYRRSLTAREADKEFFTEVDPARLDAFEAARATFTLLADQDELLKTLTSDNERAREAFEVSGFRTRSGYTEEAVARYYAATSNLYLGLIAAIDPQYADDPAASLEAARTFLDRAAELDQYSLAPDQPAQSLTQDTIELSRVKVIESLEKRATQTVRVPLNDLTVSFGTGVLYDSNVTLLGRNTYSPVDRDRKRDFRAFSSLRIDYIADLDAFAEGNQFLSRWQVQLQGRVNSTWNARIHDFNEQYYGGSANLRYEIVGPGVIPQIDGMYAHVRYDYDQIMLGNDGFLSLNRVRPMLQVIAFENFLDTSVYFAYERRNYLEELFDDRFNRDGNYFAGGFDFRLDFGKWVDAEKLWGPERAWGKWGPQEFDPAYRRPLQFLTGLEFTSNSTVGDEFDYNSAILSAGVEFPLPWGIDFLVSAAWEWQDYWHPSLIDRQRREREDFIQEYGFRAERKFYLTKYARDFENIRPLRLDRVVMTLFGDIRFTIDDSNVRDRLGQSVFEYNRIQYSAGVRFDLN